MKTPMSTPMKASSYRQTPSRRKLANQYETLGSLQVYCRVRPLENILPMSTCLKVISDTAVQLSLQDVDKSKKQYTFKKVFTESSTQTEVFNEVALPLVEQLINGGNGLLFTYGITDSGKTYTMTGNKDNVGVMPRCLDVLFNSIGDYQADKFIFKSDKMNGFEVQTEDEAKRSKQEYLRQNKNKRMKKANSQDDLFSTRSIDDTKCEVKEEDNAYGVFVTYIEVYNNFVYDLLDNEFENGNGQKHESKTIRDSGPGNTYVNGVTEVEISTTEEAIEVFYTGNRRKRMARTALNDDSSRSHSIFTIRVVQAPLNETGATVMQDKDMICVSQLSLVDLAGSERTNRTQNTGDRLTEAGKINQSLSGLRKCLENLRSNQKSSTGAQQVIPYREHKITYLFKNYFEGDGDVRMIVCVNPQMEDAKENASVLEFAEMSQEIKVPKTPMSASRFMPCTTGRKKAKARRLLGMVSENEESDLMSHLSTFSSINFDFGSPPRPEGFADGKDYIEAVAKRLQENGEKYKPIKLEVFKKEGEVRKMLIEMNDELAFYKHNGDAFHYATLKKKYEDAIKEVERIKRENGDASQYAALKKKYEVVVAENEQVKKEKKELEEKYRSLLANMEKNHIPGTTKSPLKDSNVSQSSSHTRKRKSLDNDTSSKKKRKTTKYFSRVRKNDVENSTPSSSLTSSAASKRRSRPRPVYPDFPEVNVHVAKEVNSPSRKKL